MPALLFGEHSAKFKLPKSHHLARHGLFLNILRKNSSRLAYVDLPVGVFSSKRRQTSSSVYTSDRES